MKKIIVLVSMLITTTHVFASTASYAATCTGSMNNDTCDGDWVSSGGDNYVGFSEVGTTNEDTVAYRFNLNIYNLSGNYYEYDGDSTTLQPEVSLASGAIPTRIGDQIQGRVYVDEQYVTHRPWVNY